jgi:peptidoglycan/LPS O-acetylase OafA/YrhL
MTRQRNDAIQGLRAIAALLVVGTHAILTLIEQAGYNPAAARLAYGAGELGVRMFFVISGFIMTTTMYDRFAQPGSAQSFMWRRVIRIVPLYWLVTLIYAAKLAISGTGLRVDELLQSLAFIPYDHGQFARRPIYGLGWTLNFEMFFYVMFAASLLFRRRTGLSGLLLAFVVLALIQLSDAPARCRVGPCTLFDYYTSLIILYFAAGILLAMAREHLQDTGRLPRISATTALAVALTATVAYSLTVAFSGAARSTDTSPYAQIAACAVATLLCCLAAEWAPGTGTLRRLVPRLGDASYSIYLTHSLIMGVAGRLWASHMGLTTNLLEAALFIFIVMVLASLLGLLSYRFVEQPALRLLRQWAP